MAASSVSSPGRRHRNVVGGSFEYFLQEASESKRVGCKNFEALADWPRDLVCQLFSGERGALQRRRFEVALNRGVLCPPISRARAAWK